ncbi:MAG: N,N-dimethylformamidase, partial [Acidimicrobiales bacterium]
MAPFADRMREWAMVTPKNDDPKMITGYCEPWSLRSGESIVLRASSHKPGPAELSLVRLHCGDPTSYGPGYDEEAVETSLPARVDLAEQPLVPGSSATVDLSGLTASGEVQLRFAVMITRPKEPQTLVWLTTTQGRVAVVLDGGVLFADLDGERSVLRAEPLANRRWYHVDLSVDLSGGRITATVSTEASASPGRDVVEPIPKPVVFGVPGGNWAFVELVLGGTPDGGDFDGRLGEVSLRADGLTLVWDFSQQMETRRLVETSGNDYHGVLQQLPTRGVTGPSWDSSHQRWVDDPGQWNAAHFHKDDLYDAGWDATATFDLPTDLPSGIYAFKIESEHGEDRVPFFVRPAVDAPTADVAMLMSSATYLAYANHRMLFDGADFIAQKAKLRPEHEYVRAHPELGRSMYEKHPDGSGVMFSSRLRPVLNLRPGADGWNFTPDTDINAFLQHLDIGHDILGDEDVHAEGFDALEPYRVIVTCSHPEYWSTAMLDALEAWQRKGGRLIYLGGNGFYWRVAFSDDWPGAMELRRAEDGVRNWQPGNGENYHAFTGEYGGMWRRNNRAPN